MNRQTDRNAEVSLAIALAKPVPPLRPETPCGDVYRDLAGSPPDATLAVVDEEQRPIGLVTRLALLSLYAQRFIPELYDRKPIATLMDREPLLIDECMPIEDLGRLVAIERPRALVDGFIITSSGRYRGIGTGQALIHCKVAHDARRNAELEIALAEAARARQAMSEFLALMSHELRTPLNAVLGFSDLLRRQQWGPISETRYIDYANDIHTAGSHLLSLISDILDLSKAEAGRLELRTAPMDLASAITGCIRLVHERAHTANLSLAADLPPGLPLLDADVKKVKQALINLLSNAIKFTPAGGRIRVTARLIDHEVVVAVSDTGIGIAAKDIPIALSPFGQIDSSLARRTQGTGLGLPLVKQFMELHGGRLDLVSDVGAGTTASIIFPRDRILAEAA